MQLEAGAVEFVGLLQAVLSNWGLEFVKWAPAMGVVMYDGTPEERKQLQRDRLEKGTFNVLITHYDLVMRDKAALRKVCLPVTFLDPVSLTPVFGRLRRLRSSHTFGARV